MSFPENTLCNPTLLFSELKAVENVASEIILSNTTTFASLILVWNVASTKIIFLELVSF